MPADDVWQPLNRAAEIVGVHRVTLSRWVKAKRLKTRKGQVRNLQATLVNIEDVRRLVGEGLKPGRPPKG